MVIKLKHVYVAKGCKIMSLNCYFTDRIEELDATPLINILNKYGGWPVLGDKDGGSWNADDFDFESTIAQAVREGGNSFLISVGVDTDLRNSTVYVLAVSV